MRGGGKKKKKQNSLDLGHANKSASFEAKDKDRPCWVPENGGSDKKGTPNKPSVDISSAGPRRAAGIDVEIRSDVSSPNVGWVGLGWVGLGWVGLGWVGWGGGGYKVARTTVQSHQTRVFCLLYTLLH